MTRLQRQAFELLREIPDEKIIHVINILEGVKKLGEDDDPITQAREAFISLEKYRGRLPASFDEKTELKNARDEKNARFN